MYEIYDSFTFLSGGFFSCLSGEETSYRGDKRGDGKIIYDILHFEMKRRPVWDNFFHFNFPSPFPPVALINVGN